MSETATSNRVFGERFRALRRLKENQGVVTLLGTDLEQGGKVIIKTAAAATVSFSAQMRLEHEADVLRKTESPFITSVLEIGRDDDLLFLVTPFVAGVTLEKRLREGLLSIKDAITVGRSVLTALWEAHDRDVLHRDVKPANVIVDADSPLEKAVLVDFGFARSGRLGASIRDLPVETARYISPEQAGLLHHEVDERSDLYSAGVILFECLAGRPPFEAASVGEMLRRHVVSEPPELGAVRPEIPHALGEVAQHLLRKDPRDRYQSAEAAVFDLEQIERELQRGVGQPTIVVGLRDRRGTLTNPAFIGREGELAALEGTIESVREGRPGLVLLEALSGGGKTRLLDELARRAGERGAWVLRGQGMDQVAQRPLQALDGVLPQVAAVASAEPALARRIRAQIEGHEDALVAAVPQLRDLIGSDVSGSVGPEEHGQHRILRALTALLDSLGSKSRPALLFLDDCQWADELTAGLIRFWNEHARAGGRPVHVLMVVAFRSEEVSAPHPLRQLPGATSIELPPLPRSDVGQLIESMAGPVPEQAMATVTRLSDGSPFMAAEVLRGLVETGALVPERSGWRVELDRLASAQSSKRAAAFITSRLEQFPAEMLRLLSLGAVLGKEFDLEGIAALAGEPSGQVLTCLREAERRHVLWAQAEGTRYVFVHDKLRETLLERLSERQRRALHRVAAERIESLHPDRFFDLAYHFDAAGERERALPYALDAAEHARARYALEIAEGHFRIAESGVEGAGTDVHRQILEGLGNVQMLRGHYREAANAFEAARPLAETDVARAQIDGKLGELAFKRGDVTSAAESIERGLRLLGQRAPSKPLTFFAALLWEVFVQALHTLFASLFVARRRMEDAGIDLLAARLYSRLAHCYWFRSGRVPCGWAHLREMNLAERYPPSPELAQAYSEHAPVMTMVPYFRRGLKYGERSLEIRKSLGDVWGQGQSLNFWGAGLYSASRFGEAIEKLRDAIRILDSTGDRWEVNTAGWHLALCLYRLGRLREAIEMSRGVHRAGVELGDTQASGISLGVWAKASGGKAPRELVQAELARENEDAHTGAEILQARGVGLLAEGRPGEAVQVLEQAQRVVKRAGLRQEYVAPVLPWLATALRTEAEATQAWAPRRRRSLLRRARRAARKGIRMARSFQNNLPHALRERGLLEAMRGHASRARRLLDESIAVSERQGADYERAQTLLARGAVGLSLGWSQAESDLAAGRQAMALVTEGLEEPEAAGDAAKLVTLSLVDRFAAVLDVGRKIASALSREAVFEAVGEAALIILRGERCVFFEVAADDSLVAVGADSDAETQYSKMIVRQALATRKPVLFTEESEEDTSESAIQARTPSVLCAPILVRGRPAACFYVINEEIGGLFSEDEERLAQFISALAGAALENAEGFAEIEELSRSLEGRVEERTAELADANLELKQEVTERKRGDAELRNLAAIIESSDDAIVGKDLNGRILTWNRGAERIYGYPAGEIVGRSILTIMPVGHEQELEEILSAIRRGEGLDYYETRRITKSGAPIDVSLTISPVRDESGEVVGCSSIARDVTEHMRAERYFRAQHEVTRALAEAESVQAVVPRVLELLGEALGWDIGEFWHVEREKRVLRCAEIWHGPGIDIGDFEHVTRGLVLERGIGLAGSVWERSEPALIKDVQQHDFERLDLAARYGLHGATAVPVLSGRRVLGVMAFFSKDVKALDPALRDMMATLSTQVGQFVERKRAEEEADRVKDEFFSLVSHEFRTPLTSIVGYVELLLEGDAMGLGDEEKHQFLSVIKRNSDRLRRLVDDLLFISKVQGGKFTVVPRALDFSELVEQCVEALKPAAREKEIEVDLQAEALPPFFGDSDRLAQLFDNLLSNAVKYTPRGERVHVELSTSESGIVSRITNTGVQIPPDEVARLFEPFFRASTVDGDQASGVGLGLTIAKSIAEAHLGQIVVESTGNLKTAFRVELPLRVPADDPRAVPA